MQIQIHVPRPALTLVVLTLITGWFTGWIRIDIGTPGEGIGGMQSGPEIAKAQFDMDRERIRQAVLGKREQILRYEVQLLEVETVKTHDIEALRNLSARRAMLMAVLRDKKRSEQVLLSALEQLWNSQGTAYSTKAPDSNFRFQWPVKPKYGLSAHFSDAAYRKLFGFDHHAVDIPTEAGTQVLAAADGTVSVVSMNGYGYSFVTIKHAEGFETIYGHVSQALVKEGDEVQAGEAIALSNGAVGGLGTGPYSTGPHLHWAVKKDGVLIDPEKYVDSTEKLSTKF